MTCRTQPLKIENSLLILKPSSGSEFGYSKSHNSALVFAPRYDTLVDGSSFDKNFLAIYLPAHENRLNAANYFSKPAEDSEWRNIPPAMSGKLWLGYRTPQRMGATNELVVIMEHYPVAGRIWTNYYNSGTWQGWKSVSPE